MSNKVSNFPNAQAPALKAGEMAQSIKNELELATWPKVDTSKPEEVKARILEYFKWCIARDSRPHLEQLALTLSVTRQTLWNWSKEGSQRGEIINWAKQILASMHEQWGISGKLNPVTFIFLAKNNFGYRDDSLLRLEAMNTLNNADDIHLTREQIMERYKSQQEFLEPPSKELKID